MRQRFVKYPNRRIYDRKESRYTVLGEVAADVLGPDTVEDKRSGQDITAEVLALVMAQDIRRGAGPGVPELRVFMKAYRGRFE